MIERLIEMKHSFYTFHGHHFTHRITKQIQNYKLCTPLPFSLAIIPTRGPLEQDLKCKQNVP
jgi:hypothetical protein